MHSTILRQSQMFRDKKRKRKTSKTKITVLWTLKRMLLSAWILMHGNKAHGTHSQNFSWCLLKCHQSHMCKGKYCIHHIGKPGHQPTTHLLLPERLWRRLIHKRKGNRKWHFSASNKSCIYLFIYLLNQRWGHWAPIMLNHKHLKKINSKCHLLKCSCPLEF